MLFFDTTYFAEKVAKKYDLTKNQFTTGFFFSFGFSDNLYKNSVSKILNTNTNSALKSDWLAVGADFKKVIDKELAH